MSMPSLKAANAREKRVKEDCIESAKHVLSQIQLRANLEKTAIVRDCEGNGFSKVTFTHSQPDRLQNAFTELFPHAAPSSP